MKKSTYLMMGMIVCGAIIMLGVILILRIFGENISGRITWSDSIKNSEYVLPDFKSISLNVKCDDGENEWFLSYVKLKITVNTDSTCTSPVLIIPSFLAKDVETNKTGDMLTATILSESSFYRFEGDIKLNIAIKLPVGYDLAGIKLSQLDARSLKLQNIHSENLHVESSDIPYLTLKELSCDTLNISAFKYIYMDSVDTSQLICLSYKDYEGNTTSIEATDNCKIGNALLQGSGTFTLYGKIPFTAAPEDNYKIYVTTEYIGKGISNEK